MSARGIGVVGAAAVAGAALFALPFSLDGYTVSQITQYLIFIIAVLGLNILAGYSGQLSLGHGAFIGVGAYVAALLMSHLGWSYLLVIPAAAVVCAIIGYVVGFPALRLHGHYLALATFGLALALPQILKYRALENWTGGTQGIVLSRPASPFKFAFLGEPLDADRWLYFVVLITGAVVFIFCWNLLRGRVGRAFVALRDHPVAAATMGVNVTWYKMLAFAISSAVAGIAGALLAITTAFVAPDNFHIMLSISLLVGAVIGGISTVLGAFFGGLFVQVIPEMAHELSHSAPSVVYGAVLLCIVYLMPDGIVGFLKGRLRRWIGWRSKMSPSEGDLLSTGRQQNRQVKW